MLQDSKGALRLLLLACLVGLVAAEVGSFCPCLSFFHRYTPPTGIGGEGRYAPVCQRYRNQYRFASLYDRLHRTPLYSAYLLTPAAGKRPKTVWKYEPQLAFSRANPEILCFPEDGKIDQNVIESQAVPRDYTNSTYTRGHLNPSSHHHDMEDRNATFTLTNIVPQKAASNAGTWARLEKEVGARLQGFCLGPAYVITGALPYASGPQPWINNRVAVPEYLWSAYCCPAYNASLPKWARPFFPTYAAVGRNDPQSGPEIVPVNSKAKVRGYDVKRMPLADLEDVLEQRLAMPVTLFQGQCV
ncbi:hypothetical protein NHX12_011268 [Muraenolepis orangiensis]|uniref:Endonuclease n=1 Tax=Muraenolepis orangiensis TaxID=630683 RepID=A0A9Q0DHD1_9TELE|nr:hypothetical protein NHX12_011268 [Muraenolepis orangiensis]